MAELLCPGCRKPTSREGNPYRPFCSKRCQLLDLGAWLGEAYVVPGEPLSPLESDTAAELELASGEAGLAPKDGRRRRK